MNKTVVMAYYWDSLTVSGGLLVSIPGGPLGSSRIFRSHLTRRRHGWRHVSPP